MFVWPSVMPSPTRTDFCLVLGPSALCVLGSDLPKLPRFLTSPSSLASPYECVPFQARKEVIMIQNFTFQKNLVFGLRPYRAEFCTDP